MKVILYSPWPDMSFEHLATQYAKAATARPHKTQKTYEFRRYRLDGADALNPQTDRIYVLGHGLQGINLIRNDGLNTMPAPHIAKAYTIKTANNGATTFPALSPSQLISQLATAGLSRAFVDIRLWVCKGGNLTFTDFGHDFANQVRGSFPLARVTMYTGVLTMGVQTGKKFTAPEEDWESEPARTSRLVINPGPP
jgi:hypothetical protein